MGLASWCVGEALSTLERTQRPQDPRGWGEQRHLCTPECAPCGSSRSQSHAHQGGLQRSRHDVRSQSRAGIGVVSGFSLHSPWTVVLDIPVGFLPTERGACLGRDLAAWGGVVSPPCAWLLLLAFCQTCAAVGLPSAE